MNLMALSHAVATQTRVHKNYVWNKKLIWNYTFATPPPPFRGEAPGSRVNWYGFKLALRTTSVKRLNFQSIWKET